MLRLSYGEPTPHWLRAIGLSSALASSNRLNASWISEHDLPATEEARVALQRLDDALRALDGRFTGARRAKEATIADVDGVVNGTVDRQNRLCGLLGTRDYGRCGGGPGVHRPCVEIVWAFTTPPRPLVASSAACRIFALPAAPQRRVIHPHSNATRRPIMKRYLATALVAVALAFTVVGGSAAAVYLGSESGVLYLAG